MDGRVAGQTDGRKQCPGGQLSRGTNAGGTNVGGTLVRGTNVTPPIKLA